MNGMSRFLSRRDKHHEKRASKHANTKVRLSSFASVNSLSPLLCPAVATAPQDSPSCPRRLSAGIETLYHKLPFVSRTSVEDSLLFLHQKLSCRVSSLTPSADQTSTSHSSDYVLVQSKSNNPSPDLYKIFTNEGPRPPANVEAETKVCKETRLSGIILIGVGQDAPFTPTRRRHNEHGRGTGGTCSRLASQRHRQSIRPPSACQ
jgi:hypothetical protein